MLTGEAGSTCPLPSCVSPAPVTRGTALAHVGFGAGGPKLKLHRANEEAKAVTGRREREARNGAAKPVGAEVEVTIERILPGGAGPRARARAHHLGRALCAGRPPACASRAVSAKLAFASIEEIISASPLRVEPPCPYFGRCGGCDFQQLSYDAQLAAKVEIIRDCLRRIARIEPPDEIPITPSPLDWHYRSRAQWQYDSHRHSRLFRARLASHLRRRRMPGHRPRPAATLSDLRDRMRDGIIACRDGQSFSSSKVTTKYHSCPL